MTATADDHPLTRARLCELAEVERAKHSRWQERGLLRRRRRYGLLDLLQAAQLDELGRSLGPKASSSVWLQVSGELGVAGRRLEVVTNLATLEAVLARSDTELAAALPRGERVMVVDLSGRSARARERLRIFSQASPTESEVAPAAGADTDRRRA
jgi:hypothetical protein